MGYTTKNGGSQLDEPLAAFNVPLSWLGIAVGAASAISAIVRVLEVGLFGVFNDFVRFYRGLLSPIYEFVNWPPWPFYVSPSAVDLLALYLVLLRMS